MNNELISVEIVPHEMQRYPTVGDWQFEPDGGLLVNVSRLSDPRYMILVAIHEIIEAFLCKAAGISEQEIDAWDMSRQEEKDPGEVSGCPYLKQHFFAATIEIMLADKLHVDWIDYEKEIDNL